MVKPLALTRPPGEGIANPFPWGMLNRWMDGGEATGGFSETQKGWNLGTVAGAELGATSKDRLASSFRYSTAPGPNWMAALVAAKPTRATAESQPSEIMGDLASRAARP